MAAESKFLAKMRANPKGDWGIDDISTVCVQNGLTCTPPSRGSHHKVSSPYIGGIVMVPHNKPIKTVYVKQVLALIDAHAYIATDKEKIP